MIQLIGYLYDGVEKKSWFNPKPLNWKEAVGYWMQLDGMHFFKFRFILTYFKTIQTMDLL